MRWAYLAASHSGSTGADEPSFRPAEDGASAPASLLGGAAVPKAVLLLMIFLRDQMAVHATAEGCSRLVESHADCVLRDWAV